MTVDEALEILSILLAMQQDRDKVRSVLQAVYEHGKAEGAKDKEGTIHWYWPQPLQITPAMIYPYPVIIA